MNEWIEMVSKIRQSQNRRNKGKKMLVNLFFCLRTALLTPVFIGAPRFKVRDRNASADGIDIVIDHQVVGRCGGTCARTRTRARAGTGTGTASVIFGKNTLGLGRLCEFALVVGILSASNACACPNPRGVRLCRENRGHACHHGNEREKLLVIGRHDQFSSVVVGVGFMGCVVIVRRKVEKNNSVDRVGFEIVELFDTTKRTSTGTAVQPFFAFTIRWPSSRQR